MKQNEKAEARESNGSNKKQTKTLTMKNLNTTTNKFQYHCSFCACELSNDSVRFNGVGACPACDDLAHLWVKSLREHAANYFNNLGVRK